MTNEEINELMATEVMGYEIHEIKTHHDHGAIPYYTDPKRFGEGVEGKRWIKYYVSYGVGNNPTKYSPTTDMNQAMECVGKMNNHYFVLNSNQGGNYDCSMEMKHYPKGYQKQHFISNEPSAPLAICKAILKAKGLLK